MLHENCSLKYPPVRYAFNADQFTTVRLEGTSVEVCQFLRNPDYLVEALLESDRVRVLGGGCFEVRMSPIQALGTQIQPVVQLRITTDSSANVRLEAIDCEIRGNDWFNRHFDLNFVGTLVPLLDRAATSVDRPSSIELSGQAKLQVHIALPPLLQFTPKPLIDTVGNTITRGVLTAIERSLRRKLPERFRQWQLVEDEDAAAETECEEALLRQAS